MARAGAVSLAYLAYARATARKQKLPTREAARSLWRRVQELFEEDWRDAEAGYYPRELIAHQLSREYASALPLLLADLPRLRQRVLRDDCRELPGDATPARYPDYYARNFHFQTEGYLGSSSAALYDLQVQLLFGGTADAMRRRLIRPVVQFARAHGTQSAPRRAVTDEPLRLLDVACGTGQLLRMMSAALGGSARLSGLDLSAHYVERARQTLQRASDISLVCDNAERLPFPDHHFDVVTNLYLLHELPAEVRRQALREMARVLRPGGRMVVADSIQLADAPELREQILSYPEHCHEPYYLGYAREDLAASLRSTGLRVLEERHAFLTKIVTAERPLD